MNVVTTETSRQLKTNAFYLAPGIPLVLFSGGIPQYADIFLEVTLAASLVPFLMAACAKLIEVRRREDLAGRPIPSAVILAVWTAGLMVPTAIALYLTGVIWIADWVAREIKLITTMSSALLTVSTGTLALTYVKSYLYDGAHVRERRRGRSF